MHMNGNKGFTLVELLIVISIIGILAAGAIPNLLRARMSANEASAGAACKTIAAAQTDYHNNSSPHSYAESLSQLSTGFNAGGVAFIDPDLGKGLKHGYNFEVIAGQPMLMPGEIYESFHSWSATAWPIVYSGTGVRSFYIDETGVVRAGDINGERGTIEMECRD